MGLFCCCCWRGGLKIGLALFGVVYEDLLGIPALILEVSRTIGLLISICLGSPIIC